MAALIAFRNAARTPERSSSLIARVVVPPGDVTASRSSTGCISSSRRSRALPNIVCTTSFVDTSRLSPSRRPASIIASASSAKYAGPEPESAVTASRSTSETRTTAPRWPSASSASARSASPAERPAAIPAIPSCTSEGAFGIARTTLASGERWRSMNVVVTPAATERITCSEVTSDAISPSTVEMSCGLTATMTSEAPATASTLDEPTAHAVALTQLLDTLGPADGHRELVGAAPARAQETPEERLAEAPGAEDRDPPGHRRPANDVPWLCDGAWQARGPSTRGRTSASRG